MRHITLGKTNLYVPTIAIGCMHLDGVSRSQVETFVQTALDEGANFFDHADVYAAGKCEEIFADVIGMNSSVREKVFLQSKVGIKPGVSFDFSKKYILEATDAVLKRLKTDYLDTLLLHRPDALFEPEEVAEAFDILSESGKVRNFGVSNQDPNMIQLLQKYVKQPIAVNQLQLSITNATMITQTLNMNMSDDLAIDKDNGILNFCRLNDITIQAWSPLQYGFFAGTFLGNDKFPELNAKLQELADKYNTGLGAIAFAWILRHPAKIQPVTGTVNPEHLKDILKAADIELTREEWYAIYLAAGHRLP
ncbi:MAG: aldo/keto reductase [Clostridiales Family XIII bacterium]|jgi:predicted oxidoreductase|nr:aldo/keto reductase [Clostridiales Family XIII bacterium]